MNHSKPCKFIKPYTDDNGKKAYGVYCDGCSNCEVCGWNPKEQQRRLAQGKLEPGPVVTIRIYSGEADKRGQTAHYAGLKSLIYPPRYGKGKGRGA